LVWSFFFGLIIASSLHVGKKITKWNFTTVLSLLIGTAIAAYITIASPASTTEAWWFIMFSGSIAITAMILPGISGSFILLLLGKYEFILDAVKDFQISIILLFAVGCVIGIISFSNLISWLFRKVPEATLAVLTGFMIGSLNKLWPWKEVSEQAPFLERSISPARYSAISGDSNHLPAVIICALTGFLIIFIFDLFTEKRMKKKEAKV
jgi:putative membrane protein